MLKKRRFCVLFILGLVLILASHLWQPSFEWTKYWGRPGCAKRRRVALVKVHKAASTTLTSILQRFGTTHNLTFALPRVGVFHIGLFETLHPRNVAPIPAGETYDILCQHVVYNEEAFRKYLPPDTAVIASVREPVSRFVSAFQYFVEYRNTVLQRSRVRRGGDVALMREYLKNPEFYEPRRFKNGSLALNRMSFDFGLPKERLKDAGYVEEYIKMVDRNMVFVLVAEHFDESLVILKRKLCWSSKDILYTAKHTVHMAKVVLPADVKQRLIELSASDYQIYNYFKGKFQRVSASEVDLAEEVDLFRQLRQNVTAFCNSSRKSGVMEIRKTPYSEGFNVTKSDCEYISLDETQYVLRLKEKLNVRLRQQNQTERLNG